MRITITKEEAIKAICTELLDNNGWIDKYSSDRPQRSCHVCAVGAVIRQKIRDDATAVATNFAITNCIEDVTGKTYLDVTGDMEDYYIDEHTTRKQAMATLTKVAIQAVSEGSLLRALSFIFESVARSEGIEDARKAAAKFVKNYFPATFEVDIPKELLKLGCSQLLRKKRSKPYSQNLCFKEVIGWTRSNRANKETVLYAP